MENSESLKGTCKYLGVHDSLAEDGFLLGTPTEIEISEKVYYP